MYLFVFLHPHNSKIIPDNYKTLTYEKAFLHFILCRSFQHFGTITAGTPEYGGG
jgi:hypothetical protein